MGETSSKNPHLTTYFAHSKKIMIYLVVSLGLLATAFRLPEFAGQGNDDSAGFLHVPSRALWVSFSQPSVAII